MKIVFKKAGKDGKVVVEAETESELKKVLAIANYEIFRSRYFEPLKFEEELVAKADGEKVPMKVLINKIEKELNSADDDDEPKKKKKKDKDKDKKKKKDKDKKKKKKDKDKKKESKYYDDDDDKETKTLKIAKRI